MMRRGRLSRRSPGLQAGPTIQWWLEGRHQIGSCPEACRFQRRGNGAGVVHHDDQRTQVSPRI
jgi:hypothetical protein